MCSPYESFARRWGEAKPVLCAVCMEWKALDELEPTPDGRRWDVCNDCAAREREAEAGRGRTITCPKCNMTSHSPNDVWHRYCGNCHEYIDAAPVYGCARCGARQDWSYTVEHGTLCASCTNFARRIWLFRFGTAVGRLLLARSDEGTP